MSGGLKARRNQGITELARLTKQSTSNWSERPVTIGGPVRVVMVGNMGSRRRLSYTVLGADVNLAQRLESNAPPGGILISDRTHTLILESIRTVSAGTIRIKGMAHPVPVYEVVGFEAWPHQQET